VEAQPVTHPTNETESAIRGSGYGSTHTWERGYTGANRATPYQCKKCGVWFNHHYPSTPNIFEAMAKAGVPDLCEALSALEVSKP